MKFQLLLAAVAGVALVQPLAAQTEIVLYDNVVIPLDWSEGYVFPEEGDTLLAQQFITGELGLVSSVSFPLGAIDSPSGVARFEIWDDDGGEPGKRVASIGEINPAGLKAITEGGQLVTFDTPVTGLAPNSPYYLVSDVSETNFSAGSFGFQMATASLGTGGADLCQFLFGGSWRYIADLLPDNNFYVMTVIESSDDVPAPFAITSIVRGEDATTLTWRSQAGKTYSVEFSPDLSAGSWEEIDDLPAEPDGQTSYVDSDAGRLLLARGFYRVVQLD